MASAKEIIRVLALRTGTELEKVQELGTALIQSGDWTGDARGIVRLLLAMMAGAEPKSAASVSRHYYDLRLVGDKDDGTPTRAGEMIEAMLKTFLEQAKTPFSGYAYHSRLEVYSTASPAICIVTACYDEPLTLTFLEENNADTFHGTTVRNYAICAGKVLFDIAADIVLAPVQYVR